MKQKSTNVKGSLAMTMERVKIATLHSYAIVMTVIQATNARQGFDSAPTIHVNSETAWKMGSRISAAAVPATLGSDVRLISTNASHVRVSMEFVRTCLTDLNANAMMVSLESCATSISIIASAKNVRTVVFALMGFSTRHAYANRGSSENFAKKSWMNACRIPRDVTSDHASMTSTRFNAIANQATTENTAILMLMNVLHRLV